MKSAFSPIEAASEGLRLIRREPRAVFAWLAIWMLSIWLVALSTLIFGRATQTGPFSRLGVIGLVIRLGPAAILLLFSFICTTTATFRAVLKPGDRRGYFLRFGADELRVSIALFVGWLLAPLVILAANYLIFVIATPIMGAAPAYLRETAVVGALVTSVILFWIFVRLSLIPAETFDEGRFHLSLYWPVTKGHFWYLLSTYIVWGLVSTLISAMLGGVAFDLGVVVFSFQRPHTFQILLVLLIVPIVALTAMAFMLPWTLLCACQAYAYRAIATTSASTPGATPEPAA